MSDRERRFRFTISLIVSTIMVTALFIYNTRQTKPSIDKMPFITYEEFMEELDAGNVDAVFYASTNPLMYYVVKTEESSELSYTEKQSYRYPSENYYSTQVFTSDNLRGELVSRGIYMYYDSGLEDRDWSSYALTMLPAILIGLLCVVSLRNMSKNMMNANRLDSKVLIQKSDKMFSDVIGHDEVIEDIKFMVEILKDPNKGSDIGAKPPKGILFKGPPGTGKTLLAKAIAGEAGVPFLYVSGSQFKEMYVGVGAKRVRDLFAEADKCKPCIIFIDEIDACGADRDNSIHEGESNQTINEILTQMDGFKERNGIFIIAATNKAHMLDPALTRPGRFDRQIYVNPPADWRVREQLLKFYLNKIKCSDDIDTEVLSKQLVGFTGADIEMVCNEAAIIAMMAERKFVSVHDLEDAIDKKLFQGNKSNREAFVKDKQIVAYHEASHAVMTWLSGLPISRASIQATTSGVGGAVFGAEQDTQFKTRTYFRDQIKILYAGYIGELIMFNDVTTGAHNDIEKATDMCSEYVTEFGFDETVGMLNYSILNKKKIADGEYVFERIHAIAKKFYTDAEEQLTANKHLVCSLAAALLEKETLSGTEIDEILRQSVKAA